MPCPKQMLGTETKKETIKRKKKVRTNMPRKIHPSITTERIIAACERREQSLDNPGFCIACGEDADGCEPDARGYECECCGEHAVYGAEELLMVCV